MFFIRTAIEGVDIASLEVFDYSYATDKNHVYYEGEIIALADVATFKKSKNDFTYVDKNYSYKFGEITALEG